MEDGLTPPGLLLAASSLKLRRVAAKQGHSKHRVGELYGIELSNGVWGAAQVVTSKAGVTRLAALDWFGDRCPSVATLSGRRLLVHDHHAWSAGTLTYRSKDEGLPASFVLVGQSPTPVELGDGERRGSQFMLQLRLQERWLRLPAPTRDSYKRAQRLEGEVEIVMTPEGATNLVRGSTSSLRIVGPDADRYGAMVVTSGARLDWKALDALGALDELAYEGDDLGLIEYLETKPLIQGLGWWSDAIKRLDLRGTHLTSLGIRRMPKLSRVLLPECCENLNLSTCGKLSVAHPGKGEQLKLSVNRPTRSLRDISGLARLRHLCFSSDEPFDCEELSCFPELAHIELNRVPRLLSVEQLAKLTSLRRLEIDTCYDFDGDKFPIPAAWPNLELLSIDGLRKTDAATIKRRAGRDKRLKLRHARTAIWLKTNLNNPFRDWPEHHSTRKANAAKKAYNVAVKAIAAEPQSAEQTLRQFVDAFNKMDAKEGVDTADREEIAEAFLDLAAQAGADVDHFEAKFDEWRDF